MLIRQIFSSDVTRPIPPVVYFLDQTPQKLLDEVSEYIVTGGWPDNHPNHRRVPNGIHEQYVSLINAIASELERAGGSDLPNCWISGFYGSGKSSFAKLLGMALDGKALPDGTSLAEAWLRRDTSPCAAELRDAWTRLRQNINPVAVVFDIGAVARDNEQIHSAVVRQVQLRLGYCGADPLVALFELKLERENEWKRFEQEALKVLKKPWAEARRSSLAEEDFSAVMASMFPAKYVDPMAWYASRAGTFAGVGSPEDAVHAIRDMLKFRAPNATLFLVVDEVSQYVLNNTDRVDRLRAFVTSLGAVLKGKVWLMALGQQRLEEQADGSFLDWAKARFPAKLRVHLAATNIRDVIHKRLLAKKPSEEATLLARFEKHRADLKLFAYGGETLLAEDYVETYPLLPGHIDLLLQITTALRIRSSRVQGDDQAIRGLLQMLGELFRGQKMADEDLGALITLDRIYEVQHTALDSDTQSAMARILSQCSNDAKGMMVRAAKVVALLELIQEVLPTDAKLVAQCLYDRDDRGSNVQQVTEALEELRRRNLVGYSEKLGYKLQSSAGEEWERERREIGAPRESIVEAVQSALVKLLTTPERPKLHGRPINWEAVFSDGRRVQDATILPSRDDATVKFDLRYLTKDERTESAWVKRSGESNFENTILWTSGDQEDLESQAREFLRSQAMVNRFEPRRESLTAGRKMLLQQEKNRAEELDVLVKQAVAHTWMSGRLYFRGESIDPRTLGNTFPVAQLAIATSKLPNIYNRFVPNTVQPSELMQLLEAELSGPSPQFLAKDLGILEMDGGRYVPTCAGVVPKRVEEFLTEESGVSGSALLAKFGGPPCGYPPNLVKACVAGLLRAGKVKISPEAGDEIHAVRDAGAKAVFEADRAFKRATFYPADGDVIGFPTRAKICKFFEEQLKHTMDREDAAIADAVEAHFHGLATSTREVLTRLQRLPDQRPPPDRLVKLQDALEQCMRRVRQTHPTVLQVKAHLDVLRDGVQLLKTYEAELTQDTVARVVAVANVRDHQAAQLEETGNLDPETTQAIASLKEKLSGERPWRELSATEEVASRIRTAYQAERTRLLARQEELAELARKRLKGSDGFSTLTADQSHQVLRPIALAQTSTTADAIAPALPKLKDSFDVALHQAEDQALTLLDEARSQKHLVVRMDLHLRNREVGTEAEVDALLADLRKRLLEKINPAKGTRVRIV